MIQIIHPIRFEGGYESSILVIIENGQVTIDLGAIPYQLTLSDLKTYARKLTEVLHKTEVRKE